MKNSIQSLTLNPSLSSGKYAGFWPRLVADFIDSTLLDVIAVCIGALALAGSYGFQKASDQGASLTFMTAINPFFLQIILVLCRVGLSLFYYTWATYKYQTTMGKRFFNIYVVSAKGDLESGFEAPTLQQALLRFFGYAASYLTFGAGFSMILFHPEKKGLHDLIAGTLSIQRSGV